LIPAGLEVTVPLLSPSRPCVLLTVSATCTVKVLALIAAPPCVVTLNRPVLAPAGTVARIAVADVTVKLALAPLKLTAVTPVKFVPLIVTLVPAGPLVGVKPVIVGGISTVKLPALIAVPPGVVTLSGPVIAPAGTVA
jgi:hypothetical protein